MSRAVRGVVLVGGKSSRFGRDKLKEPFAGRMLVERAIDAVRRVTGSVALVGACAPEIAAQGDLVLPDAWVGQGPMGGILTAIEQLESDVLVLAGDLPTITERTLEEVLTTAEARADAWIVRAKGEPLIALYRREVAPTIRARLALGRRALFDLAPDDRLVEVDVDRNEVLNANTPLELARAARLRKLPVIAAHRREESNVHRVMSDPRSVRLSITDRCDFACTYCRPSRSDGYADTRLSLEGWRTTIKGLITAGIRRVRITGGEPLLHPNVVDIVRAIAELGIEDLALTTNASQLVRLARPLRDAGLMRVNVSIDTLDPARFASITRGGRLEPVLEGIEAAREAGLHPIKLNTVVLRHVNDDELESITRWAWARGLLPRFLEVMAIGEGAKLTDTHLVTTAEMRSRLAKLLASDEPTPEPDRGPARYVSSRDDGGLRVGFISGASDTYCAGCDRLRVSSTGVLRPCLATDDGIDARAALESGDIASVPGLLHAAWAKKPDGSTFRGCTEPSAKTLSIRAIGG